jgi:hypothetical protein
MHFEVCTAPLGKNRGNMKRKLALTACCLALNIGAFTFTSYGGPLALHPRNPRYFGDRSGRAIYLTGSHVHNNLVEHSTRPVFDYAGYLDFLQQQNHNFGCRDRVMDG